MKTRSLLVSLPGHPFDLRTLLPNHRLAGLAGGLWDAGHDTQVLDYGTLDTFDRLFPKGFNAITRPLADRLFSDRKANALDTLAALWRLRGLKGALRERRRDFINDVVSELASADGVDFILFDVARAEDFSMTLAAAWGVRSLNKKVRLIASGPFIQRYAPLLAGLGDIFDCFCTRDAERGVVQWAEHLDRPKRWNQLPNLSLVTGVTENGCSGSLNSIPLPIYDEAVYPALAAGQKFKLYSVECSRGCSGKCPHCPEPTSENGTVQIKSARRVCEELARIVRSHDSNVFRFSGSIACANYAASVAYEILSRGLNLQYSRAGAIAGMNSIIFSALKASGCQALAFRVDTGSQWMLDDYYHRGFGVTATEKVLRASRECNLFTAVQLTYPAPADDYHTKEESLRLLSRTKPDSAIVTFPETIPGSAWYAKAEQYGFDIDKGRFLRQLADGNHTGLPVRLWSGYRYGNQSKTLSKAHDEHERLLREIEQLNIVIGITPESALVARVSGHENHEADFHALLGRRFFTGDSGGLSSAINHFNEKASARLSTGRYGYPSYLAAVGN